MRSKRGRIRHIDNVTIHYVYDFDYVAPVEATVTIDGEVVATVMTGDTYVLPELAAGKYYVGYEGVTEIKVMSDIELTTATYTYDITVDGEVVATVDYGTVYTLPTLAEGKYYVETEETTFTVTEDKAFTTATYKYDITIDGTVVATVEHGATYTLPQLPVSKYYVGVTEKTFTVTGALTFTTAYKTAVDSLNVYDADANGKTGAIAMWGSGKTATHADRLGLIFSRWGGMTYGGTGVSDVNMFGTFADYADTAIGVRFWAAAASDEVTNNIKVYIGAPGNLSDNYARETLAGETVTVPGTTWTQYTVMFGEDVTAEDIAEMTHIMFTTPEKDVYHYVDDVELLVSTQVDSAYDVTIDGTVVDTVEHNSIYTLPTPQAGKYYVETEETKFVVTSDLSFTTATYTYDVTIDGVVVATVAYGETFTLPAVAEGKQYVDGFVAGQEFVVTEALAFATEDIPEVDGPTTDLVSTNEGASIRLNEVNGMRFYATVNGDISNATEIGIIIAPKDIVGDYFTMEDDHIKVVYEHKTYALWDDDQFVGSIVNIAEKNLARDFIARAYVVIDGVTYYAETTTVRNIARIADEFITDPKGNYDSLEADVKAMVDTWAKAND